MNWEIGCTPLGRKDALSLAAAARGRVRDQVKRDKVKRDKTHCMPRIQKKEPQLHLCLAQRHIRMKSISA